ncbi:MAG: hypothetical protein HKN10_12995 [Myxococcales bacterium]|nr:hypothetical protein [Myxococcales bacterium]
MSRDVGVGQLVQELERRGDRLPFEIGAFVALEACEGLLLQSVRIDPDDVRVTLEGSVVVSDEAERADPDEAARSLVFVLARLLVAAGPGVPPHLLQLVRDGTTEQNPQDLRRLHDAIEASLIPINRGASRRVLARLVRESDRPPAPEPVQVDPRELDTELEELLGDPATRTLEHAQSVSRAEQWNPEEPITERIRVPSALSHESEVDAQPDTLPVPPSRPAVARSSASVPDRAAPAASDAHAAAAELPEQPPQPGPEPITATIRKWSREEEGESAPESAAVAASGPAAVSAPVPVPASVPVSAAVPEPVPAPVSVSASASGPSPAPGGGAEAGKGTGTPLETPTESVFGTGSVSHAESIPAPLPVGEPEAAPVYDRPSFPVSQPPKRRGGLGVLLVAAVVGLGLYALISSGALDGLLRPPVASFTPGIIDVTVKPSDAQVFVFVGRGPAIADGLAVDADHEFIVFDRGLRPSRAIVARGASWTNTGDGLIYELAIQADAAVDPSDELDFGVAKTKPSIVDTGARARVRVVTNPPGAKVYRYLGAGPNVRVRAASIQEGQEILVVHPERETRRAVIGPSDWQSVEGQTVRSATLQIELPELPTSAAPETPEDRLDFAPNRLEP